MNLMGLTDENIPTETDGSDWSCPIPMEDLEVFCAASNHMFVRQLRCEGVADGFIHKEKFDKALDDILCDQYSQCDCVAHKKLSQNIPETDAEDIKQIIRTPPLLCQATGNNYAVALLQQLFKKMKLPMFRATSGSAGGVSYVLLCENIQYSFRGVPDYLVHKDLFGAGRVLVATGEIQSTSRPDIQNSIYGIGSLLNNLEFGDEAGPILCITMFKKKSATLSVAKRAPPKHAGLPEVVGTVSLKYLVSPSPMDLDTISGLKTFATRIYHAFKCIYIL